MLITNAIVTQIQRTPKQKTITLNPSFCWPEQQFPNLGFLWVGESGMVSMINIYKFVDELKHHSKKNFKTDQGKQSKTISW
jgi:hypothetical protein